VMGASSALRRMSGTRTHAAETDAVHSIAPPTSKNPQIGR
jgi:hypothetical protein